MKNTLTLLNSNLFNYFVGFDDLFEKIENAMNSTNDCGFPPFDIYTEDVTVDNKTETHTFIKFALAGIRKEDLHVSFNNNILEVYSDKKDHQKEHPTRRLLLSKIAYRSFHISQTISNDLELVSAKYEDGCLIIEFKKIDRSMYHKKEIDIQ